MKKELFARLDAMNASYPYLNPSLQGYSSHGKAAGLFSGIKSGKNRSSVWVQFKENGNQVASGQIVYTLNGW